MTDYYGNTRWDVLDILPKKPYSRILEVGGGDFNTALRIKGSNDAAAWGVDLRQTASTLDHFVQGSITDDAVHAALPDGYFDLVIANDVIEHIADTEAFLAILTKKLAPDGLIALSVPNARQIRLTYHVLIRGTFPRTDAGLFDRTHLRWFCKRDVIALCSACGLTMTDSQSVGRLVPRWISRAGVAEFLALQNLFVFRHK